MINKILFFVFPLVMVALSAHIAYSGVCDSVFLCGGPKIVLTFKDPSNLSGGNPLDLKIGVTTKFSVRPNKTVAYKTPIGSYAWPPSMTPTFFVKGYDPIMVLTGPTCTLTITLQKKTGGTIGLVLTERLDYGCF